MLIIYLTNLDFLMTITISVIVDTYLKVEKSVEKFFFYISYSRRL